jgi:hypothetical protein
MERTARCYLLGPCKPQVLLISRMCSRLTHQQPIGSDHLGTCWKASLAGSGLKPASVNSYLSLLGTILNTAGRWRRCGNLRAGRWPADDRGPTAIAQPDRRVSMTDRFQEGD